jgi:hypothetical protein
MAMAGDNSCRISTYIPWKNECGKRRGLMGASATPGAIGTRAAMAFLAGRWPLATAGDASRIHLDLDKFA